MYTILAYIKLIYDTAKHECYKSRYIFKEKGERRINLSLLRKSYIIFY